MGQIYLIPNLLGDTEIETVIPSYVVEIIKGLKIFASENPRNTRRFLKKIDKTIDVNLITFLELSEHTDISETETYLKYLKKGNIGIISEAGCPGIADPGADLVNLAHKHNISVIPLVGPSSILLALIASGCNGQKFSFNGYLPIKNNERTKAIKDYERQSFIEDRTQIFIETPYRNKKLFDELTKSLKSETLLTIACDITTSNEYIKTNSVINWKNNFPNIEKKPCIFIIYASELKK